MGRRSLARDVAVVDVDFGEALEVRLCDLPQRDLVDKLDERSRQYGGLRDSSTVLLTSFE